MKQLTTLARNTARALAKEDQAGTLKKCRISYVTITDDQTTTTLAHTAGDIYKALKEVATLTPAPDTTALLIETVGWAAPTDDDDTDTPPSLHPNRQRCALVIVANLTNGQQISALKLSDNAKVMTQTSDSKDAPRGTLADAVAAAVEKLKQ